MSRNPPPPEYDYEANLLNRGRPASRGGGGGLLAKLFIVLFIGALGGGTFFAIKYYKEKSKNTNNGPGGDGPHPSGAPVPNPSEGPNSAAWKALAADITSNLDTTADPCDDFYQYACGGWIKKNPLQPSQTSNSRAFVKIMESNQAVLKEVAEQNWPVIGPMYSSCLNTDALDKGAGLDSIDALVQMVSGAPDKATLFASAGKLWAAGVQPLVANMVAADARDPKVNRWNFAQGGITLPSPSFYKDDKVVPAYVQHVSKMFSMYYPTVAHDELVARVNKLVQFESAIAAASKPASEMRDPVALDNVMKVSALAALAPSVGWEAMLSAGGVDTKGGDLLVNIDNPDFYTGLSAAVGAADVQVLADYMTWKILHTYAGMMTSEYRQESFNFFSGVLQGVTTMPERWTTCVGVLSSNFGDIVGRHFVEKKFSPRAQNMTGDIIDTIKDSYKDVINSLPWIDAHTRVGALAKFNNMLDKVGYPVTWDDYAGISVLPDALVQNTQTMMQYRYSKQVESLSKEPNREAWQMSPSTVNAYYDSTQNDINFPAGILQPTFFDEDFPVAANFGGIGMVAGHEEGHSIDDQGAQYDYTGALKNWWSNSSWTVFEEKLQCLVKQYDQFEIDGVHVNGTLTLGENAADNNGIANAHAAYLIHVAKHGAQPPVSPQISNDKLFFLNFAQNWCTVMSPEYQKVLLKTDPHSPAKFRVNGPLSNFQKFSEVYNCPAGSKMNKGEESCVIFSK